jgi:hypothetical protein
VPFLETEQLDDHVFDFTNQTINGEHAACDNRESPLSPSTEPVEDPAPSLANTASASTIPATVSETPPADAASHQPSGAMHPAVPAPTLHPVAGTGGIEAATDSTDRVVDRRRAPPCALPLRGQLVRPCAVWNTPIAPPR